MEINQRCVLRTRGLFLFIAIAFQFIFLGSTIRPLFGATPVGFFVFFLLAGYDIGRVANHLADAPLGTGQKLSRLLRFRFLRIYPLMLIWFALGGALSLFFNSSGAFGLKFVLLKDAGAILLLIYNVLKSHAFNQDGTRYYSVLGTFWHIAYEEQVCLLLSAFVLSIGGRRRRFWATLIAIPAVAYLPRFYGSGGDPVAARWLHCFGFTFNLVHFLIGFLISQADLDVRPRALAALRKVGTRPVAGALFVLVALYFWIVTAGANEWESCNASPTIMTGFWLLETAFLALIATRSCLEFGVPFLDGAADFLGARFYGIYFGHNIVIRLVEEISYRLTGLRSLYEGIPLVPAVYLTLISIALMVALGDLFYRLTARLSLLAYAQIESAGALSAS